MQIDANYENAYLVVGDTFHIASQRNTVDSFRRSKESLREQVDYYRKS